MTLRPHGGKLNRVMPAYTTGRTLAHPQLLADAEFRDNGLVALGVVFLEVVEQATPLADQHEKAAA